MAGIVYCFNTIRDPTIYKLGHTKNKLKVRLRGYLGPSKPREVVLCRTVEDAREAERMMIHLLKCSNVLKHCEDLGSEWFSATTHDTDGRHRTIHTFADIVQKAVSTSPPYMASVEPSILSSELKVKRKRHHHRGEMSNLAQPLRTHPDCEKLVNKIRSKGEFDRVCPHPDVFVESMVDKLRYYQHVSVERGADHYFFAQGFEKADLRGTAKVAKAFLMAAGLQNDHVSVGRRHS